MTKDCGKHGGGGFRCKKIWRRTFWTLFVFVVIVLFVILIIYLALHPHKPKFYVQDATIRGWNVSDDGLLTSSLQFTVVSRNPNDRIGVYYDQIDAYASYQGEPVTAVCRLPPFYQGDNDVTVLPTILGGNSVPLAPFVADHLKYEQQNGVVTLNLRIDGRVRWKVGTWTSGNYHLDVNCYAMLGFTRCCDGGGQVPLQAGTRCEVDV